MFCGGGIRRTRDLIRRAAGNPRGESGIGARREVSANERPGSDGGRGKLPAGALLRLSFGEGAAICESTACRTRCFCYGWQRCRSLRVPNPQSSWTSPRSGGNAVFCEVPSPENAKVAFCVRAARRTLGSGLLGAQSSPSACAFPAELAVCISSRRRCGSLRADHTQRTSFACRRVRKRPQMRTSASSSRRALDLRRSQRAARG